MPDPTVYIVLFRGVGGKTQLPTARLRAALAGAGFANVATYINSGNALLRTSMSRSEAAACVRTVVARDFGFEKAIHLVTRAEWEGLIAANPFPEALAHPKLLHAAWLESEPRAADVDRIADRAVEGEGFVVCGRVAYIHTPGGFARSRMAEAFDRMIGVGNTARNWNTVEKLAELAKRAEA